MAQELRVHVGNETKKAFLQHGFYKNAGRQVLHMHSYAEVHVFLGRTRVLIDSEEHSVSGATLLVVPRATYHNFHLSSGARHSAFQIDLEAQTMIKSISEDLAKEFFAEIQRCKETENYSKISTFISFLCSYFYEAESSVVPRKITDYSFLINDFFSLRYTDDVKLSDLSEELCVSEKQAHRLVQRHMGRTFGQELTRRRMKAAEHLMKDEKSSLTSIAESVGYQTYSGFWKAYKRYKSASDVEEESENQAQ